MINPSVARRLMENPYSLAFYEKVGMEPEAVATGST